MCVNYAVFDYRVKELFFIDHKLCTKKENNVFVIVNVPF